MCGHLRVPEAVCRSAAGELHIWCPLHSEGSVHSSFMMLGFMQNASSFGSEELFSAPTSDLYSGLTNDVSYAFPASAVPQTFPAYKHLRWSLVESSHCTTPCR